jgi:hypothetical protein
MFAVSISAKIKVKRQRKKCRAAVNFSPRPKYVQPLNHHTANEFGSGRKMFTRSPLSN